MEANQFSLEGIFSPNPFTIRAQRVKWDLNPKDQNTIAFGCQKNIIFKNLAEPKKSKIVNKLVLNNILCVKYSPNGNYIAIGDDKGGIKIIGWSEGNQDFMPKYENENLMGGPINAIAWTEDGKKIMAVGGGAKRAVAINIDGGSSAGDCSIGHNKTHYCVDVKQTKPLFAIFGGEENDL